MLFSREKVRIDYMEVRIPLIALALLLTSCQTMQISSTAFQDGQNIPAKYTCQGDDVNPPLQITGIPAEAKSLALIVDDPDSPTGTWVHWTIWNLDPGATEIKEGSIPKQTTEGTTTWGTAGYRGPCPGTGKHRYFFKLYALDTTLDLNASSTKEALLSAMKGHILTSAELKGLYQKF